MKRSASAGATACHMACVCGLPCSSSSGGPEPPRRSRIAAAGDGDVLEREVREEHVDDRVLGGGIEINCRSERRTTCTLHPGGEPTSPCQRHDLLGEALHALQRLGELAVWNVRQRWRTPARSSAAMSGCHVLGRPVSRRRPPSPDVCAVQSTGQSTR